MEMSNLVAVSSRFLVGLPEAKYSLPKVLLVEYSEGFFVVAGRGVAEGKLQKEKKRRDLRGRARSDR